MFAEALKNLSCALLNNARAISNSAGDTGRAPEMLRAALAISFEGARLLRIAHDHYTAERAREQLRASVARLSLVAADLQTISHFRALDARERLCTHVETLGELME